MIVANKDCRPSDNKPLCLAQQTPSLAPVVPDLPGVTVVEAVFWATQLLQLPPAERQASEYSGELGPSPDKENKVPNQFMRQ